MRAKYKTNKKAKQERIGLEKALILMVLLLVVVVVLI